MRRGLVDLLTDHGVRAATAGRPSPPGPGAGRGAAGRAAAALLAVLVAAAAHGCGGARPGPGADAPDAAQGDTVAAAGDGARTDEAARRAASDRFVRRGRDALASGRAEEAAELLERAVRVDPSNGRAYLALAEARLAQGRERAARGLLERAAALLGEADAAAAARLDSVRSALEGGGR